MVRHAAPKLMQATGMVWDRAPKSGDTLPEPPAGRRLVAQHDNEIACFQLSLRRASVPLQNMERMAFCLDRRQAIPRQHSAGRWSYTDAEDGGHAA